MQRGWVNTYLSHSTLIDTVCIYPTTPHSQDVTQSQFFKQSLTDLPDIGIMVRVFAIGTGDLGSIPGRVIPKTQKMILDATLLNTQHYQVWNKGKVEQSRERSSALPLHLGVVVIEKETFGSPSTTVTKFTFTF